jgi:cyclic pyranopterin phosphate synthase
MPKSRLVPKKTLTSSEILKVAQEFVSCGISKIKITGGEPLLRKDIVYLVSALTKIKGVKDISLTTNGVLLSEYAEDLKKAGLKRINISLDTLVREKYKFITQTDALYRVLEGIDAALRVGLEPVKINVVVMNGINADEIIKFAQLIYTKPLHIRFIEFMPLGNNNFWTKDKFIPNSKVKNYCESIGELIVESSSYRFKYAKGSLNFISPISKPFCSQCSKLRLTYDGKLIPCLASDIEIDLMPYLRNNHSSPNLKELFYLALNLKPKGHNFGFAPPNKRAMSQIGG